MNNNKLLKQAQVIGIETMAELKDFYKRERQGGEKLADTLARYCQQLGAGTIKKLKAKRKYQEGKAEAEEKAKEWQRAEAVQSWGEYAETVAEFEKLAHRFGLVQEFKENGII